MNILKRLFSFLLILQCVAWSQNYFSIKLHEDTTLESLFDALINARALNYGSYSTTSGLEYAVNVTDIDIDIVDDIDHNLELSISLSLYADWGAANAVFSNSQSLTIDTEYELSSEYDVIEKALSVYAELTYFDASVIPEWFSDWVNYRTDILDEIPIIQLFNVIPDIDEYYFADPLVEFENDAIIISLALNDDIIVANRSVDNPTGFLGGTLSVANQTTPASSQSNFTSPSSILARLNDQYIATTHNEIINNEKHLTWTDDIDYLMITQEFQLNGSYFEEGLSAFYEDQYSMSIASNAPGVALEFHDPWYYDENTETQPDCYRTISTGQFQVFLEQNENFYSTDPIYSLKAPRLWADQSNIYVFDRWQSSSANDAIFTANGAATTTELETQVVILDDDATITVYYNSANSTGESVSVLADETLTLPAGGHYILDPGTYEGDPNLNNYFNITVYGDLIVEGTEENPVVLEPGDFTSGNPGFWYGIIMADESSSEIEISNCEISNSLNVITLPSSGSFENININMENCVFYNNASLIYQSIPDNSSIEGYITGTINNCTIDYGIIYMDVGNNVTGSCSGGIEVTSSIFYNSSITSTSGLTSYNLKSCDIYNTTTNGSVQLVDCITDDPLFVDAVNNDYHLTSLSPCIDTGYDPFGSEEDPDGTPPDIGAHYFHHLGGGTELTSDYTLSNDEYIIGDLISRSITIPSGKTLTVLPGASVQFQSNEGLNVNGVLNAIGTESDPIVLTSTASNPSTYGWDGVHLNSTSDGSEIRYCEIEHAYAGIRVYESNVTINDNWITDNYIAGIWGTDISPTIDNNKITDNYQYGVIFQDGGSPLLLNNTISGNKYGARFAYYTDPYLSPLNYYQSGLNQIINNDYYGIYAYLYSDPFAGSSDSYNNRIGGYNSIYGNSSKNIYANNNCNVEAEFCWWNGGQSSYYLANNSTLNTANYLSSNPGGGSSLSRKLSSDLAGDDNAISKYADYNRMKPDTTKVSNLWPWAHELKLKEKYVDAIDIYKMLVRKFPESEEARSSLVNIYHLSCRSNMKKEMQYFDKIARDKKADPILKQISNDLLGLSYVETGEYKSAEDAFNQTIRDYPGTESELLALTALVNMHCEPCNEDIEIAKSYLAILKEKYPGEIGTMMAQARVGEEVDWSLYDDSDIENPSQPKLVEALLPEKYSLGDNYPNPFNPITKIPYALPEEGNVTIKVFDIMGREVVRLVDGFMPAGYHQVIWNGKNNLGSPVSTGVYFYNITVGDFNQTNRMVLLK